MANDSDNLVLEHPEDRFRRGCRRYAERTSAIVEGADCRSMEQYQGQVTSQIGMLQAQIASQTLRMDRFDERLSRIERRLDLVEA